MKRKRILFLILGMMILGGYLSTYLYFNFNLNRHNPYKNSIFVEEGKAHGYAKVYDLYTHV